MSEIVVGATTRHASAFFLVPFMCVWSGFSLGGIYGTQIAKGEFNLTMSLFGIPFVLGSVLFWTIALMTICGKVEVRLRGRVGAIFVGIGKVGWVRSFDFDEVDSIELAPSSTNYPGGFGGAILLRGRKTLRFGSNLNDDRRDFVCNALKCLRARSAGPGRRRPAAN